MSVLVAVMSSDKPYKLLLGDSNERLLDIPENSIDAVVTDPPYELGFMGKSWDASGIAYSVEFWKKVLRVMKPGAHVLAFSGTRTYHRMVCAMEDAGFEIRDQLQWIYGSGFPKSLDISKAVDKCFGKKGKKTAAQRSDKRPLVEDQSQGKAYRLGGDAGSTEPESDAAKQWKGWGTALKPANEPIVLARKPISKKNVAQNVLKWGTGGINVDAGRIGTEERPHIQRRNDKSLDGAVYRSGINGSKSLGTFNQGRFPANVLLDEEAAKMLDEQTGDLGKSTGGNSGVANKDQRTLGKFQGRPTNENPGFGDSGGASRFFYTAKTSKWERNYGLSHLESKPVRNKMSGVNSDIRTYDGKPVAHNNNIHPTVKPFTLMRYLVRLITPPGGTVLDPFLGSGTTGAVAVACGFKFIGIEREKEYFEIAKGRIKSVKLKKTEKQ